jgi:hypothetical protein
MWHLYFSRRFDEVPEQCQKLLELDPASHAAYWVLTFSHRQKGTHTESWSTLEKVFSSVGFTDVAEAIERGHRTSGDAGAMRGGAIALAGRSEIHYVSPVMITILFALAEERERAFQWLERALEERAGLLVYLKVAPYWDSLRSDRRLQDAVRRMNFPD